MLISVVTITCCREPRLADMARSLLASLMRAPADVAIQWIIVDELLEERQAMGQDMTDLLVELAEAASDRFSTTFVPPLPSEYRQGEDKTYAHNSFRNAGLRAAVGEYVMFLDDCTVVTSDWVATVADVAKRGNGYRTRQITLVDAKLDFGKPIRGNPKVAWTLTFGVIPDKKYRPAPIGTVGGTCWGAPMDAFVAIHGFDLAYDGEVHGHDLEAALRLQRVGVHFVSTTRAVAIRLRRTAPDEEWSTRKEVSGASPRNKQALQALGAERHRTLPKRPAADLVADIGETRRDKLRLAAPVPVQARGTPAAQPRPAEPPARAAARPVAPARPSAPPPVAPGPAPAVVEGEPSRAADPAGPGRGSEAAGGGAVPPAAARVHEGADDGAHARQPAPPTVTSADALPRLTEIELDKVAPIESTDGFDTADLGEFDLGDIGAGDGN